MLQEMSRAIKRLRVKGAPYMDVESRTAFIGFIVLDKKTSQLVWQFNALIKTLIAL